MIRCLTGWFLLLPGLLWGQVQVTGISDTDLSRRITRSLRSAPVDSLLSGWQGWAAEKGYAEFSLDTVLTTSGGQRLVFHQGPEYYLSRFSAQGLSPDVAQKARLETPRKPVPLHWSAWEGRMRAALDLLQNEGYPFGSFDQPEVQYHRSGDSVGVDISYRFSTGPLVRIDSVVLAGEKKVSDRLVYSLARIHPGDVYRHDRILGAERLLNNSIYFEETETPRVAFTPFGTAIVRIQLKEKESSRFDLLAGLLPPSQPGERFQFTGSLDLRLVSPAKQGEVVEIFFNQLPGASQQARARLLWPMLGGTPFLAEGQIQLQKQEEDFFNLFFDVAAGYAPAAGLEARFFYRQRSTRLLDIASLLTDTTTLPQVSGRRNMGGVAISYENLDYRLNPTTGWDTRLLAGIGSRSIDRDRRLAESRFAALPLTDPVREIELDLHRYLSLGGRHVLHLAQRTYWLDQGYYFRNDQLQTGGARSIRGFNENAFFTNLLIQATVEYRFLLDRDAFLMGFADLAYLEDAVNNQISRPRGTGIGMNYRTRAGILSIIYAVGSDTNQPFQPARGKIHIGLVNLF